MIVPHGAHGQPVSIKIPASWVYAAISVSIFSLLLVCSSIFYSTLVSRRLVGYADSLNRNRQQQEVISSFSLQTKQVNKAIEELIQEDNELRKLLGLRGWQNKVKLSSEPATPEAKVDKISYSIERIKTRLAERRKSFEELRNWVAIVRSRMAHSPSGWPIRGRIVSWFGYRSYPWRGMHTGIDIDAHYGSPARATAAGVVTFVGWRHGYGKLVEISHGYGVKTLYAHNSAFAVSLGRRVSKGQVVSFVGMTGWTTGPHLHYEVRRGEAPLNPMAYLDLNIMSASRLWR